MVDDSLADFPCLRDILDAELAEGPDAGVQLSISHAGVTHDVSVGGNGNGAAMTAATVVPWTCSSKPIGAIAFGRAWDAGRLRPDDLVADHLPDYAAAGKQAVRIRDLLTHTSGVPDPLLSLDTGDAALPSWAELEPMIWSVITASEPVRPPGTEMNYSPISNWFTLDRLLAAIDGGAPGDSYRATCRLLGLSATLGAPDLDPAAIVRCVAVPEEEANLRRTSVAGALPLPGTGVWGTMRDLRVVGDSLLACADADANPLLAPATVEAMTSTHWLGQSRRVLSTTDFDYGLGFMTLPHLFGKECSYRTYGHAGGNNSTLLVDPQWNIVIAVYWNRRLSDVRAVTRRIALVDAIYRDLRARR
ncbi:MAG TPA: serine hydrolase domain-containing protein [Kutzneria sp.]|jgi:CubicO group peptidase (beta-lactamase class C family)